MLQRVNPFYSLKIYAKQALHYYPVLNSGFYTISTDFSLPAASPEAQLQTSVKTRDLFAECSTTAGKVSSTSFGFRIDVWPLRSVSPCPGRGSWYCRPPRPPARRRFPWLPPQPWQPAWPPPDTLLLLPRYTIYTGRLSPPGLCRGPACGGEAGPGHSNPDAEYQRNKPPWKWSTKILINALFVVMFCFRNFNGEPLRTSYLVEHLILCFPLICDDCVAC